MSIDQMRDEFEQALAAFAKLPQGQAQFKSYRSDDQRYAHAHGVARAELEIGWWAWQASRAAVVVESPKADDSYCEECHDCWERGVQDFRQVVEAAGVKVKP